MEIEEVHCAQNAPPAGSSEPQTKQRLDESSADFPVVGVGASAGGLEALEQFFAAMPPDSGMAFIVVQHLSPDFKSLMDELLGRRTRMPVHRVEDGMAVEPNAVYLIPPRKEMIIASRRLHLTDKDPNRTLSLPIDTFFRSLAQDCGEQAVAVVLSGTGSDGSRGVRAIHDAGGLVIAQDDRTAKFDGMPRSTIDTGVADFVLPPEEIPAVLRKHFSQPRFPAGQGDTTSDKAALETVYRILREEYGLDFTHYKPATVLRRIRRRLQMNQLYNFQEYVKRLQEDVEERDRLYRDLLIGVTRFFRDTEAFEKLEQDVLPGLIAALDGEEELRVWVAGCATGEEAYSIAILIQEQFERAGRAVQARVFATDVHRTSLEVASCGLYSDASVAGISPERLERHFLRKGNQYQVSAELRKLVVFAPHDVVRDAPFTKIDLVTCRNLLIYLEPPAQKRAITLFHFGLKTGGVLMLGPSESPGDLQAEFESIDAHWRLYRKRRNLRLPPDIRLPLPASTRKRPAAAASPATGEPLVLKVYDALLDHFMPPSILLTEQRRIAHTFSGAGKYLKIPDGRSTGDVLEMVTDELRTCLAAGIQQAQRDRAPVVYTGIPWPHSKSSERLRVTIRPVLLRDGAMFLQVMFEPAATEIQAHDGQAQRHVDEASRERLRSLEEDLQTTRENLQTTIEELETSNEELQAANEELVAANEELQSTNEELHSVNEELYTVNAEHQRKIAELTQLTNDMENLLRGTDVGTIFLDQNLQIRKFTPQITKAFHILPQDIGRRIDNFNHSIRYQDLVTDVEAVIRDDQRVEREVVDSQGNVYLLRILPYRTNVKVEGAVLTLVDVSTLRRAENVVRRMSKVFMEATDPIVIEDLEGRILDVNHEAEQAFGISRGELLGQDAATLIPAEKRDEELAFREKCRRGEKVRNVESLRTGRDGRPFPVLLTYSLLAGDDGKPTALAIIIKDIRERKQAETEALLGVHRRDQFLAMLSHELRNPLAAVLSASQVIGRSPNDPDTVVQAREIIDRQARQAARLLDDLLDVGRMTQGKVQLKQTVVDLAELTRDAVRAIRPLIEIRDHRLELQVPTEPLYVYGDPARLHQVIENLLTNAAKYTPHGGRIRLQLERHEGVARLQIRDTGIGIAEENLEEIFGLFTQLDSSLDRSDRGLGIGLSMVRMLVEMHGGSVCANSEGIGRGSTFEVQLPALDGAPAPLREGADQAPTTPISVLLVEDIDDTRQITKRLLALDGHRVREAADGHAGLAALISDPPDVALIDVGLPGISGYEVARIARKNPALNRVRLIALTGYGRPEDREAVLAAGFDEHLVKPVNMAELSRVLKPRG